MVIGISFSCSAQDSIVFKNGKTVVGKVISIGKQKVVYCVPPDTAQKIISNWRLNYVHYAAGTQFNFTKERKQGKPSKTEWFVSAVGGFSVPSFNYRDGILGTQYGIRSAFYFNNNIGIAISIAQDLTGTGFNYISNNYWGGFYIFNQYMVGMSYRTGGKPGYPWVDFICLLGPCTATNPVSETGGGANGLTVNTPGNGTGGGCYLGLDFTSSENHLCSLTFGVGCLGALFSYPNSTSNFSQYDPVHNVTNSKVSTSNLKTTLALPQMYLAINFRLKKAQR